MRCSALQCVAVRCSALQCVAVRCSALQCIAVRCSALQMRRASRAFYVYATFLTRVAVCCKALAVCCSRLQYVAVGCNVLQTRRASRAFCQSMRVCVCVCVCPIYAYGTCRRSVAVPALASAVLASKVAVYSSVLQRVAVSCNVVAVCYNVLKCVTLTCVAGIALTSAQRQPPHIAVCCRVLQYGAVCCSASQYAAACCSVLQCVAACCTDVCCGAGSGVGRKVVRGIEYIECIECIECCLHLYGSVKYCLHPDGICCVELQGTLP